MTSTGLSAICHWWSARLARVIAAVLVLGGSAAYALDPLPAPQGPVILLVSGNIEITNSAQGAQFDREMLYALGKTIVETSTSWTDGEQQFEGVLARAVMERVGASGTTVIATALNDFVSPVPMQEIEKYDVLLATHMNGKQMEVSDKGPIWIVYPRKDHPELQDSKFNDRWVWQLKEMRVE
jgi:hypothetical protein